MSNIKMNVNGKNFNVVDATTASQTIADIKKGLNTASDSAAKIAPVALLHASEAGDFNITLLRSLYTALKGKAKRETVLQQNLKTFVKKYYVGIEFNDGTEQFQFAEKGKAAMERRKIKPSFELSLDFRAVETPKKADKAPSIVKAARIEKLQASILEYSQTLEGDAEKEYLEEIQEAVIQLALATVSLEALGARISAKLNFKPESRGQSEPELTELEQSVADAETAALKHG